MRLGSDALAQLSASAWRSSPISLAVKLSRGRFKRFPHTQLISDLIVQAYEKPGSRFLLSMPPRHGKSMMSCVWGVIWLFEMDPTLNIIITSYGADLATKFGRKTKQIVKANAKLLSYQLAEDASAASYWETSQGGSLRCTGLSGAITGGGADFIFVDDPIKNMVDALSETKRETLWENYTSAVRTRLEHGKVGSIVGLQTRWHDDDWAGRCEAQDKSPEGGDGWNVVNLPALAEDDPDNPDPLGRKPGEALCPELIDEKELLRIKSVVTKKVWDALYKGKPPSATGVVFPKLQEWPAWTFDDVPRFETIIGSLDCSFDKTVGADRVCLTVFGLRKGFAWILDEWCKEASFTETLHALASLKQQYPRMSRLIVEVKANGAAIVDTLRQEASKIKVKIDEFNPRASKYARAEAAAVFIQQGRVFRPPSYDSTGKGRDMSWVKLWSKEVAGFPFAKHDDRTDALSQFCLRYLPRTMLEDNHFNVASLFSLQRKSPWAENRIRG